MQIKSTGNGKAYAHFAHKHYLLPFPVVYANAGGEVLKRDATNAFTRLIE